MSIPHVTKEQLDLYGNRTFDRALYVYTATILKSVVKCELNEVHRTGEFVREKIKWSVIAPGQDFADFAFAQQFRNSFRDSEPVVLTCDIFPVCSEITRIRAR